MIRLVDESVPDELKDVCSESNTIITKYLNCLSKVNTADVTVLEKLKALELRDFKIDEYCKKLTPLSVAAMRGYPETVRYLCEHYSGLVGLTTQRAKEGIVSVLDCAWIGFTQVKYN